MGNELLTAGQVARICGVHRTTVHYWTLTNKLTPALVANGMNLYHPADVEALHAERQAQGVA